jgi:hypothetical protein
MEALLYFIVIFVLGEWLLNISFFAYLKKQFGVTDAASETIPSFPFGISTFKGLLERLVLFFGLAVGFSQVLVVFGALKIGTRLEKDNRIKNDYFLIGNFASLLVAMLYQQIWQWLCASEPLALG